MLGVLALSIPRTNYVYYRIFDAAEYLQYSLCATIELQTNVFKNTQLQNMFNHSCYRTLDVSFITMDDEEACQQYIDDIIKDKLSSDRDIREICNIGDLLDRPGLVHHSGMSVATTSVYKYIRDNGLCPHQIKATIYANTQVYSSNGWVDSHLSKQDHSFDKP